MILEPASFVAVKLDVAVASEGQLHSSKGEIIVFDQALGASVKNVGWIAYDCRLFRF
ncbi:MAG: hypothetical protein AAF936_16925 [Pseudomonadota bacterium]